MIYPDQDKQFARGREYIESKGVDLLKDIKSLILVYAPILIKEDSDSLDEQTREFILINKQNLIKDICCSIRKLECEYKPEFTNSTINKIRNH